jgi:hypothetical protein
MATRPTDPELLDLAVDGALSQSERAAVLAAADGELAAERRSLERLADGLAAARVAARPGFAAEVMAALPADPAWARSAGTQGAGARVARGWRVAVAALAVLALAASVLLGLGSESAGRSVPALGALAAVGEFAAAALLSGAGLLSASWRGIGLALGEALDLPAQVVFGLGVIALNALLFLLLRRRGRRRATAAATARRRS